MLTPEDINQVAALIAAAEQRTVQAIATAEERTVQAIAVAVQAEIKASEERTNARIEHVETALLTEFQKWASPNEARLRTHTATLRAIDLEMEYLSDRLKKLEGNQPQ
jgi:uncharacterized phage protein gp47/JayE